MVIYTLVTANLICLNFGLGKQYNGLTNLRFDDTNPAKEDVEYVKLHHGRCKMAWF